MQYEIRLIFLMFTLYTCAANPADCPNVTLKNGKARKKHIFIQYSCNRGFILYGNKFSRCTNGQWESTPVCVKNRCTAVREIVNGDLLPFNRGATIQFWCKAGYTLKGSSVIYCDGAKWNENPPFCRANGTRPPLKCDFESNTLCGWVHDVNHDFDWTKYNQNLNIWHIKNGPEYDHTKGPDGDGYYMFIDASKSTTTEKARLISPIFDKMATNSCLEFFYHMRHHGNGMLNVGRKYVSNSSWDLGPDTLIFSKTGYQGNYWRRAFVNLGILVDDFQIIFEGVRGNSPECDIAIDDVRIVENCTYEDEIDDYSTTESELVSVTEAEESCNNRCSINDSDSICSCMENCYVNETCCPDYVYYCFANVTGDWTGAVEESTSSSYETAIINTTIPAEDFTEMLTEKATSATTTTTTTTTTAAPLAKTTKQMKTSSTTISTLPRNKTFHYNNPTTASTTTEKKTLKTSRTTPKAFSKKSKTDQNDTINKRTRMTTKAPIPTGKTTTPKTTKKIKIIYGNDELDVNKFEKYQMEGSSGEETPLVAPSVLKPALVKPSNVPWIILASVAGVSVLLSLTVLFYKKYQCRGRRIRSRNGMSESDIRFLASDEALDFRVALVPHESDDDSTWRNTARM